MCGIAGTVNAAGLVTREQVIAMRETLAHRGPDDAGLWTSPRGIAMLASRRLAILDLSPAGHQPMEDTDSGLVIVFNGEIYNYVELANELSSAGYRFHSRTDTEVILKAYARWGEECLEHLNGMFAFAIWDERRQQLFAARDRFGEKPFYFYHDPNRHLFAFTSEIKALIAGKFFTARPSTHAVYKFLTSSGMDAGSETLFVNVVALPAAHWLKFSQRAPSLQVQRYWDLDPVRKIRLADDREYAERFLGLLSDSANLRLRSDVPVGSSLSGGLDSSTIVGLVARTKPSAGQETFSARFFERSFDEGPHIERVVSRSHLRNYSVYPDPKNLPYEIEKLTWHQDAPFGSSSIYAQWCVMRLAREHGVTVLLDGQGGDEVLGGYHSYFSSYLTGLIGRFRLFAAIGTAIRYAAMHGIGQLPLISVGLLPAKLQSRAKGWIRPLAIQKDLARAWPACPEEAAPKFGDPFHDALYRTLTESTLPQLLRYADRNSMAFSREIRLPFLDHRLVEFLFAIPPEQKIDGITTKRILRNAVRGILPEEIRTRKDKVGFAPPENIWLRGPLCEWAEDILASSQFKQRGWMDAAAAQRLWRKFKEGQRSLQGIIWRWLSLEIWATACLSPRTIHSQELPKRAPALSALAAFPN